MNQFAAVSNLEPTPQGAWITLQLQVDGLAALPPDTAVGAGRVRGGRALLEPRRIDHDFGVMGLMTAPILHDLRWPLPRPKLSVIQTLVLEWPHPLDCIQAWQLHFVANKAAAMVKCAKEAMSTFA